MGAWNVSMIEGFLRSLFLLKAAQDETAFGIRIFPTVAPNLLNAACNTIERKPEGLPSLYVC